MATLYWRIKAAGLTELSNALEGYQGNMYDSGKEYLGLAPCHITLRKPSTKNQDIKKLVVLCSFFVNISTVKNMVAKKIL